MGKSRLTPDPYRYGFLHCKLFSPASALDLAAALMDNGVILEPLPHFRPRDSAYEIRGHDKADNYYRPKLWNIAA